MLSDEEKKAIERLNIYKEKIKDELYPIKDFEEEKAIGVVLNLIEKQSKEIEELNKSDESKEQSSMKYYNLYKELVDKIKAKIEEVSNGTYDAKIVLESLLEKGVKNEKYF